MSAAVLWITAGVGYLILEAIAAASFRPPYSYAHNYIGDLGVTCGGMIQVASSTLRWPFFLVGAVLVARAVESQKAGLVLSLAATNAIAFWLGPSTADPSQRSMAPLGCIPRAQ